MFKSMRNRIVKTNMILVSLVIIVSFAVFFVIQYANTQRQLSELLFEAHQLSARSFFWEDEALYEADTSKPRIPLFRKTDTLPYSNNVPGASKYAFKTPYYTLTLNEEGKLIEVAGDFSKPESFYYQVYEDFKHRAGTSYYFPWPIKLDDKWWRYTINANGGRFTIAYSSLSPEGLLWNEYRYFETYGEAEDFLKKNNITAEITFGRLVTQITFLDVTDYYSQLNRQAITLALIALIALGAVFLISCKIANKAIKPVEESWLRQKQFVADASHELKTPIAVISANVDAIQSSGEESVNSQSEWFSYIRAELDKMGRLTRDMLRLAKAEDDLSEQLPFDLSVVCESVVSSTEAMLYEKGIQLTKAIEKDVLVKANKESIEQAILILLDNASRYTDQLGSVSITLTKERGKAVLRVTNTGDGISPEDLPKIFDRFYRPDVSRTEESGGYGLGLAIAKAIVEKANGTIAAQSEDRLTTFTITLKLIKDMLTGRKVQKKDSSAAPQNDRCCASE